MAGGQERILRRRIRTVEATKKITRAMELIAASRIARAQQRVQAAVPYADEITKVVHDLAEAGGEASSPLLTGRGEVRTAGFVVIAADRGLCGGYNAQVVRSAEGEVKSYVSRGLGYSVVPVGRKAEGYFRFRNYSIGASFTGFSEQPTYADAQRIASWVMSNYEQGNIDTVELVYTRFISAGRQEVVRRPLVPLERELLGRRGGSAATPPAATPASTDEHGDAKALYEFEPDPSTILDELLPRYVEARVYAALLNGAASEQAARQRAMKAATDNAEELIRGLTRVMNRARQDAITTEIMEIVGGAEALGKGADD